MKGVVAALIWVAGIILAKGFWLTTLAIFCPIYGVYLVAVKILAALGWM